MSAFLRPNPNPAEPPCVFVSQRALHRPSLQHRLQPLLCTFRLYICIPLKFHTHIPVHLLLRRTLGTMSSNNLDFIVSHRGKPYQLSFLPESTLSTLHARLEELTSVPPDHQKLLFKGKKATTSDDSTLLDAGLKPGLKVQMIGPTAKELEQMRGVENEKKRVDRVLRDRAAKPQTKVCPYSTISRYAAQLASMLAQIYWSLCTIARPQIQVS